MIHSFTVPLECHTEQEDVPVPGRYTLLGGNINLGLSKTQSDKGDVILVPKTDQYVEWEFEMTNSTPVLDIKLQCSIFFSNHTTYEQN